MKKLYKILIIIVVILIVIRLILPYALLHYLNRTLSRLDGYSGHIDDLDMSIYRGAYSIKHLNIKQDSLAKKPVELFKAASIELSVEWKQLLHGHLVGQIVLDTPQIVFTKVKEKGKPDTTTLRDVLRRVMPLKINGIEINYGSVHYTDTTSRPKVDISLDRAHLLAHNMTNIDTGGLLPSTVSAQAVVYEGEFNLNMKMNLLKPNPTFDLKAELKHINLALLNDFLKAYGKFTVNKGKFSLYTEMAAKEGKFAGYVKPFIEDLKVLGPQNRKDTFFQKIWESVVGAVTSVLKNQKKDQLATKIPIQGSFKNPKVKTMYAVGEVLRNAFIQALMPTIDNEISISSVDNPNLLHQIYEKDTSKKKPKK